MKANPQQLEWRYHRPKGKAAALSRYQQLIEDLKCPDPGRRMAAANELKELKYEEAAPLLINALDDENGYVRFVAIRELGSIRCIEALHLIVEVLGEDDWSIRRVAARSLGMIGDKRAVLPLCKISDDSDRDVRLEVILALTGLKDQRALPVLIKALRDKDLEVRGKAVDGLVEMAGIGEIPLEQVQHSFMLFVRGLEERRDEDKGLKGEGGNEEGAGKREAILSYKRIADAVKRSGHSGILSKGKPKPPKQKTRIMRLIDAVRT